MVEQPFEDTNIIKLDAVFCHEITTPIAITDLMARGKDRVFDNTKIKAVIDHVTPAKDSKTAEQGKIIRDWARRNNIKDFFDIGHNAHNDGGGAYIAQPVMLKQTMTDGEFVRQFSRLQRLGKLRSNN